MGTSGTGISSNDTYADVYSEFFDLYNEGKEIDEITERIIVGNSELIEMRDESNNFWFALAKAQWDCKALDIKVHEKVREIISSGLDLEIWRDLGCSEDAIKKRGKVLDRFLGQLQSERPKAKSRKKRRLLQPIFAKGRLSDFPAGEWELWRSSYIRSGARYRAGIKSSRGDTY